MKIAIAGAGIGGLAAAVLLHGQGHEITVFEQFEAPAPVGSGLMIQPVSYGVLEALGVLGKILKRGTPIARIQGRNAQTGQRVLDVSYGTVAGIGIHRSSLFDALYAKARSLDLAWCTGFRISGRQGTCLQHENGELSARFDLIVDATGARSGLSPLKCRLLPFGAVWGTVDWKEGLPADQLSQRYRRADKMAGILPIGTLPGGTQRKAAIFWSLKQDRYQRWLDEGLARWKSEIVQLWPEIEPFSTQITDPGQMTMARYSHGTLFRPYGDRIVHIGDAAHRTSPQLGQGANMALLDAAGLAKALEISPLPDALAVFARSRRWHVRSYQVISRLFTPAYQSENKVLPFVRDHLLFPLSQIPPMPRLLSRLVSGGLVPTGV